MGCDIHLHTEVKINGVWHHYGCPNMDRNYSVFAKMADVRNGRDITPISQPRGIPDDATTLTKYDRERWDGDGHSHSWLGAAEIAVLFDFINTELNLADRRFKTVGWWCEENFGYLFGNTWGGFTRYPDERPEGLEDIRFVFWFDN